MYLDSSGILHTLTSQQICLIEHAGQACFVTFKTINKPNMSKIYDCTNFKQLKFNN